MESAPSCSSALWSKSEEIFFQLNPLKTHNSKFTPLFFFFFALYIKFIPSYSANANVPISKLDTTYIVVTLSLEGPHFPIDLIPLVTAVCLLRFG
ncbi:hypothetical protein TorRG33x02_067990 [Trema orientale]|uniref:Transmembrane protein n=1 Tax=Trema orientale TaxID=63057 RepID=A0A2P5FHS7_TREOI|nr:hypothetical protein TorRG33x02_067990 [Trema orientale]